MSLAAKLILVIVLWAVGFASGIKYHAGQDARAALIERNARESDMRQQRTLGDRKAGEHANRVDQLSTQLGNAREKIASLSGRACLDADTVRMLNNIGNEPVRALAGQPAHPAEAVDAAASIRYSTERDVARSIAECRAQYTAVADQLNKILDIEDRRHPPDAVP